MQGPRVLPAMVLTEFTRNIRTSVPGRRVHIYTNDIQGGGCWLVRHERHEAGRCMLYRCENNNNNNNNNNKTEFANNKITIYLAFIQRP